MKFETHHHMVVALMQRGMNLADAEAVALSAYDPHAIGDEYQRVTLHSRYQIEKAELETRRAFVGALRDLLAFDYGMDYGTL